MKKVTKNKKQYYATILRPDGVAVTAEPVTRNRFDIQTTSIRIAGELDTNCEYLYCSLNKLTKITALEATYISAPNNQLTMINAPNVLFLDCSNNKLTELNLPKAELVDCGKNNLTKIVAPNCERLICYENPNLALKNITVAEGCHIEYIDSSKDIYDKMEKYNELAI